MACSVTLLCLFYKIESGKYGWSGHFHAVIFCYGTESLIEEIVFPFKQDLRLLIRLIKSIDKVFVFKYCSPFILVTVIKLKLFI